MSQDRSSSASSCGHSGAPRATGQLSGVKVTQDQGRGTRPTCAAGRARLCPACRPRGCSYTKPLAGHLVGGPEAGSGGGVVGRPVRPLSHSPAPNPRAVQPPPAPWVRMSSGGPAGGHTPTL